ncbi:MAG: hypothetical protein HY825_16080 [Acidobacteria bacterium]|nr:hypothetical protein [Acidobacteriota bacterium]
MRPGGHAPHDHGETVRREGASPASAGHDPRKQIKARKIKFRTIMIDPPWPLYGGGKCKRGADRYYKLLSPHRIWEVVEQSDVFRPASTAHLYVWVPNNFMPAGVWLIEKLGFEFKTCITWAKRKISTGQYYAGQTEQLLFGVRGRGLSILRGGPPGSRFTTLVVADHVRDGHGKIVHSAKPDRAYAMVEQRSPGPRLEMFARRRRPGWWAWGDELAPAANTRRRRRT